MSKVVYEKKQEAGPLAELLESYFSGLSFVCHDLFGKNGEDALYTAIGEHFIKHLEMKTGLSITGKTPWDIHCKLMKIFTDVGFFNRVEMEVIDNDQYKLRESGQYASDVWVEQDSWQRGTPPCPLWASTVYALGRIGYTIVLDNIQFFEETKITESIFHYKKTEAFDSGTIEQARSIIAEEIVPICMHCKKIRDTKGEWHPIENYLLTRDSIKCSHGICKPCKKEHYPDF